MAHRPMYCSNNDDDPCVYTDGYIYVGKASVFVFFSLIQSMTGTHRCSIYSRIWFGEIVRSIWCGSGILGT